MLQRYGHTGDIAHTDSGCHGTHKSLERRYLPRRTVILHPQRRDGASQISERRETRIYEQHQSAAYQYRKERITAYEIAGSYNTIVDRLPHVSRNNF